MGVSAAMRAGEYLAAAAALHDQIANLDAVFDCFGTSISLDDDYLRQLETKLSCPPRKPNVLRLGLGTFDGAVSASHGLLSILERKAHATRESLHRIVTPELCGLIVVGELDASVE